MSVLRMGHSYTGTVNVMDVLRAAKLAIRNSGCVLRVNARNVPRGLSDVAFNIALNIFRHATWSCACLIIKFRY